MTNDELIKEILRIEQDEYSIWFEFVDSNQGLIEIAKDAIDDKSKSDSPFQLLESILIGFEEWKEDLSDAASNHDPSVGFDGSEAIRILREAQL